MHGEFLHSKPRINLSQANAQINNVQFHIFDEVNKSKAKTVVMLRHNKLNQSKHRINLSNHSKPRESISGQVSTQITCNTHTDTP